MKTITLPLEDYNKLMGDLAQQIENYQELKDSSENYIVATEVKHEIVYINKHDTYSHTSIPQDYTHLKSIPKNEFIDKYTSELDAVKSIIQTVVKSANKNISKITDLNLDVSNLKQELVVSKSKEARYKIFRKK